MNKIFPLLTGLFLLFAPVGMSGCDDSDKEVVNDGRMISNVVIPTSMTVFRGMDITVDGQGFRTGDAVSLRDGNDLPAATEVLSESAISFAIPEGVTDQGIYKVVLTRGSEYQVLGASKLTVQLAMDVELPGAINTSWGKSVTIKGRGFQSTDKLTLIQGGGNSEIAVSAADETSLTFTVPDTAADGPCEFILHRGDEEQSLGSAQLYLTYSGDIPDKDGATVKGIVLCQGKGVPGVLVSDGDLITETDANGHYWLESKKRNSLVFIILPAGYDVLTREAIPQFWHPCTLDASTLEQLDFQLLKSENDAHTMLVSTDMHLANRNTPTDYVQFANGFISELTSTYNNAPGKVYMLNLGDFSWDGYWYTNKWALPECKTTIKDLGFQMWSVMGNHDNDPYIASDFGAEAPYRQNLGPVYYAMNIGKIHYIMLDNTEYINTGGSQGTVGSRNYNRRFSAEQLAWLREELKHVDKSTPIVVGCHCPLYSYNSGLGVSIALQSSADVDNILGCFDGFSSVTFLTGHTHINRNIQSPKYANVHEHNIAAVCGTWWWTQQYGKNNLCKDGSPAGYKIFTVSGTDMKWQYKSVGLPLERQFTTYDMNVVNNHMNTDADAVAAFTSGKIPSRSYFTATGENVVFINVWDYEPGWKIEVKENGKELDCKQIWKYDPMHAISYDIPRAKTTTPTADFLTGGCPHMFTVTASSATSSLDITVTDRFNNSYTETMTRPKAFTTDLSK